MWPGWGNGGCSVHMCDGMRGLICMDFLGLFIDTLTEAVGAGGWSVTVEWS